MTTMVRYPYTLSRVTKIKKTDNTSIEEDVVKMDLLCFAADNATWCSHFGKHSVSSKVKYTLSLNSSKLTHSSLPKDY